MSDSAAEFQVGDVVEYTISSLYKNQRVDMTQSGLIVHFGTDAFPAYGVVTGVYGGLSGYDFLICKRLGSELVDYITAFRAKKVTMPDVK